MPSSYGTVIMKLHNKSLSVFFLALAYRCSTMAETKTTTKVSTPNLVIFCLLMKRTSHLIQSRKGLEDILSGSSFDLASALQIPCSTSKQKVIWKRVTKGLGGRSRRWKSPPTAQGHALMNPSRGAKSHSAPHWAHIGWSWKCDNRCSTQ